MSHAPAIDIGHDQPPLPNQHFSSWLRSQTALFISQIVAILGSISLVASTIYYVRHLGGEDEKFTLLTVRLIVDSAHLGFIAVFILFLIQVLHDNDRGSYRVRLVYERVFRQKKDGEECIDEALNSGKRQLRKFKRRFLLFWIGMLFLYLSFACQHIYDKSHEPPEGPARTETHSTEFTLSLKSKNPSGEEKTFKGEMNLDAEREQAAGQAERPLTLEEVRMKLAFSFWEFFLNNLTLMFVFWCFLIMYLKPEAPAWHEWAYLASSLVVVMLLAFLFRQFSPSEGINLTAEAVKQYGKTVEEYSAVFDALSGIINAVVLALLIARLDSKLVGLPSWLISILYSYAAVQPLFIVFQLSHSDVLKNVVTFVLIFVFVFKIYFFLIIFYALQTGKMLNYLCCFPILRKRVGPPDRGSRLGVLRRRSRRQASVFERLKAFVLSSVGKTVAGRRRARPGRAHLRRGRKVTHHSAAHKPRGPVASWLLRSRYTLWVGEAVGGAAILYFVAAMVGSRVLPEGSSLWNFLLPPEKVVVELTIAQLVAAGLFVAFLLLVLGDNGYGRKVVTATVGSIFHEPVEHGHLIATGKAQMKKFKLYFLCFWVAMFLLYVTFLLELLKRDPPEFYKALMSSDAAKDSFYPVLEFLLASLTLMFAFWCFVVFQSPAFAKPAGASNHLSDVMFRRLEARQKHFEARQRLLINYSIFAIVLLIAFFTLLLVYIGSPALVAPGRTDYMTVFYGVTGLLSAVIMALLIARMDSKLFNLPSHLIWMLFAYASIQALFIAFPQDVEVLKTVRTSALTSALGLKICFFLAVAHSLQNGNVLNYLVCFPLLKERIDSIFENQFEIKLARVEEKDFTFSILKKNHLHYSTTRTFESREECDEAIEELRELMGKGDSYGEPRKSAGTYWLEVRRPSVEPSSKKHRKPSGELLCESIPLRSEEEALDLMDESLSKVPYCKYNRL